MLIFAPCRTQMQALACFQRSTVPRVLHLCYHASFCWYPLPRIAYSFFGCSLIPYAAIIMLGFVLVVVLFIVVKLMALGW